MSKQLEQILSRIAADAPHAGDVRGILTGLFAAVDGFTDTAKAFAADKNLSRDGAKAKAREALPVTVEAVRSYTAALSRLAAALADNERGLHAKLAPRPADVLQFAQQQEVRGYLAALPAPDRLKFALSKIDDLAFVQAVLSVPFPELSGLPSGQFHTFANAALAKHFAAEVEQISKARETLAVGNAGKAVALQSLQSAADIPAQEFAAMLEGKEDKPAKPSGFKGKAMTQAEFNALPEEDRRMMHAARNARIDAFARGEKWAREKAEQDRAEFLWPPAEWERASA